MRSEIGKLTLDETFEKRDEINQKVVENLAKETEFWGIQLLRYEVRDIEPPNQILTSMTLQAEAERSKRAEILGSEGTKMADINIAQAKRQSAILEAEGSQEKQVILAQAQGTAFRMIESELASEKGKLAANFLMGQKYIKALAQQAKPDNMFLVRSNIDTVPSQVADSLNLLDLVNSTKIVQEPETPATDPSVAKATATKPAAKKATTTKKAAAAAKATASDTDDSGSRSDRFDSITGNKKE